jgi:hypothetical protein
MLRDPDRQVMTNAYARTQVGYSRLEQFNADLG